MGPSGAGKTTFLDIVTGRKKIGTICGSLLYDGKEATPHFLRHCTAYVEQFDTLLSTLTVRQMLLYQAELKCNRMEKLASKKERVERLLVELGLENCADVMIGDTLHPGISGGQAKRTNIGIALVTEPKIIFLDEPTSGLDSQTSLDMVSILRKLASQGVTIMSTIHSPTSEAFRLFDSLLLLVKGQTVYFGPLHGDTGAAAYFAGLGIKHDPTTNLADFLIRETGDSSTGQVVVDVVASWKSSKQSTTAKSRCEDLQGLFTSRSSLTTLEEASGFLRHNAITAAGVLLRYRTRANYKFPDFVAPRVAPCILFGLIIGSLYWNVGEDAKDPSNVAARGNVASVLYMSAVMPSFTASGYMPSIVIERPLFYRETSDGCYSALTYVIYKLIEEAIPQLFGSLIFCLLTFFLISFQGNFFWHWLIFILTGQTGIALAYVCGSVARNMDEANTLLPAYNVVGMFFGGVLFTYNDIPSGWQWYTWTCFVRYAWCAHMVNNFGTECEVGASDMLRTPSCPIEYWGVNDGSAGTSVSANIGALAGFWGFWVLLAWLAMANIRHSSR